MKRFLLTQGMMLVLAGTAWADSSTPDAGKILRELAPSSQPVLPPVNPDQMREQLPPPMKEDKSVSVTVQRFQVEGNSLLSDEEVQGALSSFIGRPLGFEGLQAAAAALANAYRAKGWFVRTYLPEQTIRDGVVVIRVVEAKFGGVKWEGEPPRHISGDQAEQTVATQQQEGQPVSYDAIDRAVLLLEDLPGEKVQGSLAPGRNPGEVVLRLRMADADRMSGYLTLSNGGSRATGKVQFAKGLQWNSPAGIGDQISLMNVNSKGAVYGRAAYSLPVGYDGFRLGGNASSMRYWLGEEYRSQGIHGQANTVGMDASYPLIRGRMSSLYLGGSFDHKRLINEQTGASISGYSVRDFGASLSGFLYDGFAGGGYNTASLQLVAGNLDLSGSANRDSDETGARTAGDFTKLVWQINRLQRLTEELSLYGNLTGQLADSNLDSSERFSLGGSSALRAYPAGEASGSEGFLSTLELRWRPLVDWTFALFTDNGHIRVNHGQSYSGETEHNHYSLHGVGLSSGWAATDYLQVRTTLSHRLGRNPAADANGNDNDGKRHGTMLWLSAQVSF